MRPWNEEQMLVEGVHALPLNGKAERLHLYQWIGLEERYVQSKFETGKFARDDHDQTLRDYDLEAFWIGQIVQYYDRAKQFLRAAATIDASASPVAAQDKRTLEMKAQQALAKAMMTAKGCVESSIRVFGNMPMPGVESGEIQEW